MKSYETRNRFNSLFESVNETKPIDDTKLRRFLKHRQAELNNVDCEIINGRPRARLSRDQADTIIDLVNVGRAIAQESDKWQQEHLDIWDTYWNGDDTTRGIEHTLAGYQNPNLTLKQLLWCVNSITKTQGSRAVPDFVKQAVRTLRQMEREAGQ